MRKPKTYRLVETEITAYGAKGNGRGKAENPQGEPWVLDVPFTMPGDRVRTKMLSKRSGIHHCQLEELLQPAPDRVTPRCVHFGTCGGCRWQHLSYEQQLKNKELIVRRCFSLLLTPEVQFHSIQACDNAWEYRNKMEFSFSANKAGDKFLGLIMDSSRGKVLNLTECHLVHHWHIDTLKSVRNWWESSTLAAYHPSANTGSLRTLTLREGFRTGDRMVMLTVSGNPDYALHKNDIANYLKAVKDAAKIEEGHGHLSVFLRIHQIAKGMASRFYEMHLEGPETIQEILYIGQSSTDEKPEALRFKISPVAFFQPNTLQAEKLYSLVLQLAEIPSEAVVYDLYCGTGTMGICLAKHVKQVIGVEISPEAVLDARANAALNGVTNYTVLDGAVGSVLGDPQKPLPPPDVVLLDPPRAGLEPDAIKHLLALKPSKIVYVSCNPASQAMNIAELIQGGYTLNTIQPVDQFPQTVHIENIAILSLSP